MLANFHEWIEAKWDEDNSFCNEVYYKKVVALALLYAKIKKLVTDASWCQEKKGNLAQIVAYTFSKLVKTAEDADLEIDLMAIWSAQEVLSYFGKDILAIAKMVFDDFYDPKSMHTDVREYCKNKDCWEKISKLKYSLSEGILEGMKEPDQWTR
jgi:hypothetical protein